MEEAGRSAAQVAEETDAAPDDEEREFTAEEERQLFGSVRGEAPPSSPENAAAALAALVVNS